MKNKNGASLAGFSEVAIFFILIMGVILIIVSNMNIIYEKNNDATFGIAQGDLKNRSIDYQSKIEEAVQSGEASTNTISGVSLTTIWAMIKLGLGYTYSFITGSWISGSVGLLGLEESGDLLAVVLRILYSLAIGFIAIKLIMKVKA